MRSREAYRKLKRQRVAEESLSVLRGRVMADRKLLNAIRAVLVISPSHKLLRMPSPVKKSTKHVQATDKVTSYKVNPDLVSQTGQTRTIYREANEELTQIALSLSMDDRRLLGVQTIKVEWVQEDALHFLWRMRSWYTWVLATWHLCSEDHLTFVTLLTENPTYGGKPFKEAKPKKDKLVEGTKSTDALNHTAFSFDTLAGWEVL